MAKNKVPKELLRQITIVEGIIKSLCDFTDVEKIQLQHYGDEFQEALVEMQKEAMALRGKLEIFKNKMEEAATYTFYDSARFASAKSASSDRVVDGFLAGPNDE